MNDGSQVSPQLKNAAPVGQQKRSASNGLVGECAYEAGQMVQKPNGGGNMVYGMNLADKKNTLANYAKNGQAFYGNQGQAKVGNSIISNESKTWGHVMVINEIKPDGSYVVSEYNRAGKKEFNNSRVIKPDAPFIVGVIDTKPNKSYQVAPNINQLATDAKKRDPLMSVASGAIKSTVLGGLFNQLAPNWLPSENSAPQETQTSQTTAGQEEITPQRKAVRNGSYTLPASQLDKLAQYNPQAYDQYMSDLNYAADNKDKVKTTRLPADKVVLLEDAKFLPGVLNTLEGTIKSGKATFDPIWGNINAINPLNAYDTDQQTTNAELKRATQLIGKYMEGGVLRPDDEIKYSNMLPKATDTREVALKKLSDVRNMLEMKTKGYISGFDKSGYDVSGYMNGQDLPQFNGSTTQSAPNAEIPVIEISTGRAGTIPANEFDPKLYSKQ
jgi:surface antigen